MGQSCRRLGTSFYQFQAYLCYHEGQILVSPGCTSQPHEASGTWISLEYCALACPPGILGSGEPREPASWSW